MPRSRQRETKVKSWNQVFPRLFPCQTGRERGSGIGVEDSYAVSLR